MVHGNIFNDIPQVIPNEIFNELLTHSHIRIERILSKGHCSEEGFWYDQSENEWILLIQGRAVLEFEQSLVELKTGDYFNIPAHVKHRVKWTDPDIETIWLAIFY